MVLQIASLSDRAGADSLLKTGGLRRARRAGSHKRAAAVRAIERVGASVVYLPPYSPDLNPIELAFAKVKARLRAAELRTIDKVEDFFGTVHDAFTPQLHPTRRVHRYTVTESALAALWNARR